MLDATASLLDQSLLVRWEPTAEESRFGMLETIREFAGDELRVADAEQRLHDRHADYYLALVESAGLRALAVVPAAWRARLIVEQENLRTALDWVVAQGDAEAGLRFVIALEG